MTVLFIDFGAADLYVGQVKVVLDRQVPYTKFVDLLHKAPALNVKAG